MADDKIRLDLCSAGGDGRHPLSADDTGQNVVDAGVAYLQLRGGEGGYFPAAPDGTVLPFNETLR